jgi:hypothetical protein
MMRTVEGVMYTRLLVMIWTVEGVMMQRMGTCM